MRGSVLVSATAATVLAVGSAIAADLPVKAPVYSPPPVAYGWTGFYLGANVGLSVARDRTGFPAFSALDNEQFNLSPIGVIGGGQIGYNWQVAPNWVLGVEADFQGSGQRDSSTCVSECLTGDTFAFQTTFAQRLSWFGTARGRLGWTNGPVLLYGTGGWAYGKVETDFDFVDTGRAPPSALSGRFSQNRSGWAAGGGIEAQLVGNWTGKIEYLYVDLGSVAGSGVVPSGADAGFTFAFSSVVHDHIIRAGVNYKLGEPIYVAPAAAPGLYKAPVVVAAYNWSGFYIGGNVGLSAARNPTTAPILGTTIAEKSTLDPFGAIGGGQVGWNSQVTPNWVLGVEADLQASGEKDDLCFLHCVSIGGFPSFLTLNQKLAWFGTARGRFGWTNGPALFYATGGLAYGKVTTDVSFAEFASTGASSFSQTKTGWTVGGGVEVRLVENWTAKVEYLYIDLGSVSGASPVTTGIFASETDTFSSQVHDHVARVGLNYKFGADTVVAKY